jgi:formate hydrogenlyase transcriptional activator
MIEEEILKQDSFPPTKINPRNSMAQFEMLISDLSARFINLLPEQVDQAIEEAQRNVCECLGLDLSALWQWPFENPDSLIMTHLYPPLDGPPVPVRWDAREGFPWCQKQLLAGKTIALSSLEEAPAEAARDVESWRFYGVKTTLTFPLSAGNKPPIGAISFNSMREERVWSETMVKRLQLVAQVFANALVRQNADRAVQENGARFSLAVDSANLGLWALDLRTDHFWISEKARTLFGFAADEEVSFERFLQFVHPEDRQQVRLNVQKFVKSGENFRIEYSILRPDGTLRWILSQGRTHFDSKGEPERIMGVSTDITDQKKIEVDLQESKARLDSAIDVADLAFYDINSWDGPVFFDNRFQQLIGIPSQEVHRLGDFWFEHIHPDDRELLAEARQKLRSGQVNRISLDYRYCHPERGVRWLSHISKVLDGDIKKGNPRVIGVVHDITERKEMETKLKSQLLEIEMLKQQLEQENLYLRQETKLTASFENLNGSSAALKRVMTQAQQVAATNSTVLILGETGTGKELIAQAIHNLSPRKKRVLVKVNCASLPTALVESELFGREKGAYTGAMTSQVGRFELANGSTLFLDEIGEMSLEVQAKLLRILQEGEFERLGSPKTVRVDVRVIAATNRNLLEEVHKGRFREDLYYRLGVFPIEMPPLRLRLEDIPSLVSAFIREFSQKMGKNIHRLPKGALEAMQKYHWPGNIRELRNLIEQAFIISEGEVLKIQVPAGPQHALSEILSLEDVEYQHILYVLQKCRNRIKGAQGAAQLLGLHPATLYSKMKKLGIPTARLRDDISTKG